MVSQLVALLIALDPHSTIRKVDISREPWKSQWPTQNRTYELEFPLDVDKDRRVFVVLNVADTTMTTWVVRKLR